MRIVNLETFLTSPEGTIFQKYQPCVTEGLCIFQGRCGESDFFYQSLDGTSIEYNSSSEFPEAMAVAQHKDVPITLDSTMRDGCFEPDQLFLVWSDADKLRLSTVLGCGVKNAVELCDKIEQEAWEAWERTCDPQDQGRSIGAGECSNAISALVV